MDEPLVTQIGRGSIADISGGAVELRPMAKLWGLPDSYRRLVELGIGLSAWIPSGISDICESIAGTCHFGFGRRRGK